MDPRPKTAAEKGKQKVDDESVDEDEEARPRKRQRTPKRERDGDNEHEEDEDAVWAELLRLRNKIAEDEKDLADAQAAFEAGKKIGFASEALIAVARTKKWAWVRLALLPTTLGGGSSLGMCELPNRFRGNVIEGVPWLYHHVTRADGSLTYVLEHPDPVAAPEAFCFYHDYYKQGHFPVEDRDRDDISALLNRAAQLLPAPFLSLPSSSSSSFSSSSSSSAF